jgi:hypothetical protein
MRHKSIVLSRIERLAVQANLQGPGARLLIRSGF